MSDLATIAKNTERIAAALEAREKTRFREAVTNYMTRARELAECRRKRDAGVEPPSYYRGDKGDYYAAMIADVQREMLDLEYEYPSVAAEAKRVGDWVIVPDAK